MKLSEEEIRKLKEVAAAIARMYTEMMIERLLYEFVDTVEKINNRESEH